MSQTFILDVSSFQYRAYHASKERPTYTKDRVPNAAVNLFRNMLERLKRDHQPDYLVAACDSHTPSFRVQLYPLYKATRLSPPEEYVQQLPGFRAVLNSFFIPTFEVPGYEADDIIGTLAAYARKDSDVVIVSGDKDMAQLVAADTSSPNTVRLLNTNKNKILGPLEVYEEYGVWPDQIVDYLALTGDTSDNVPGADGVGPAGALTLLRTFGNVEGVIKRVGEIASARYRHAVQRNVEMIKLSKTLVTINCKVPLENLPNLAPF